MAKESRSKSVLGGGGKSKSSSSKGKRPHSVHVKHGASGGYIATHHFKHKQGEDPIDPEDHVLPDQQAMLDHMEANMPDQGAEPPAASAAAPAVPPAAAPTGM
jgi:hypothetical protein